MFSGWLVSPAPAEEFAAKLSEVLTEIATPALVMLISGASRASRVRTMPSFGNC